MQAKVYNTQGEVTSKKVTLAKSVYGVDPNDHAIYLDVKQHLANKRQGTHKAKERSEIAGSSKKIKKQKGTGGARVGNAKSGTRVGGGRIFGPRPRNYHFKINVKVKRLARKSAFSYKAKSKDILVLEDLNYDAPKTKEFISLMSSLKIQDDKTLLVLGTQNDQVYKSARNLKKVKVVTADTLNTFDLLNAKKVVLSESSLEKIENILN
ncbi:MAG: 50S ribosomal protein L4 [Crocinitomicaceae bacterium]|nr:50S ribosomal protein L4 [Crocinitomicaceae bacterium]